VRNSRYWTVANAISFSRFVLAIAFVLMPHPFSRVVLILVAALTDFLDGFVARISDTKSPIGALIDPIADRTFVLAAVCVYLFDGIFGTGQYFVFISRDLATAIGFLVARMIPWLRPVVFQARLLGKAVTVLQLATLVAALVFPSAISGLIIAIGLLSAMSIVDYTLALWRARVR
jgi:cardiolipin synthase (CMP-forming)